VIVRTTRGQVRGRDSEHGAVFRGIPYAAPIPGPARFDAPAPPEPWDGVRDATLPEQTAPVPQREFPELDMTPFLGPGWVRGDEYLAVNVRTPDPGASGLPVMVFVHGGAFISGSTRASLYEGAAFARDGVVLVTVTYRLGAPGWLSVPGRPDNRGLLDVQAALRWVQEEIAAFGGDPGNVTLFGQSAGAMITAALLADPGSRGLFRRAISQSGSGTGALSPRQARVLTAAMAEELGVAAEEIPQVSDDRLLAATPALFAPDLTAGGEPDRLLRVARYGPVLETLPADAVEAGAGAEIDLLVGTTTEETNLYLLGTESTSDDLREMAARCHGDPDALVAAYRAERPDASVAELYSAVFTDGMFGAGSRRLADAHSPHPAGTYRYEFAWRSPAAGGRLGAAHGVELPFVFDCAADPALHGPNALLGEPPAPESLAREMHSSWISFATTGDPGWPPHALPDRATYRFDTPSQLTHDPRARERAAW